MVIVSRHGAQLAFVGIFCGFARARLERNQDLRNQQVAIRDTMLGAEPRNLLIRPHVLEWATPSSMTQLWQWMSSAMPTIGIRRMACCTARMAG
jgi:hypothetical protein